MPQKRFDHPNGRLEDQRGHNGVELPEGVTTADAAADLYSRLGTRFPVKWEPWSPAEPKIDTDDLPNGVTETDVENALKNMKANGRL